MWVLAFILLILSGVILPVFVPSNHICAEAGTEEI
jgi:hypothetical protein